jgi:flagellar L-ring protein precursor FlgH
MKRWFLAVMALVVTAISIDSLGSIGRADSVWDRRDPRYGFLFQDTRARNIGDILTVSISENTVANEQDQRTLSRTTSGSGSVTLFDALKTPASSGTSSGGGTAGSTQLQFPSQNTSLNFTGNSQNTVNRVFTDTMMVTVVDLMPNGNLVVEGYRSRVVAGEERVLRITGVVRQADIGVGNIVTSGSVANCRISYLGRGPTTRNNKQGFLTRLNSVIRLF